MHRLLALDLERRHRVGAFVARGVAAVTYKHRAVIELHAPIAEMREKISPMAGQLEALDAKTCLLQTGAFSFYGLVGWIAGIGVDFDVREPPELVAHIERVVVLLRGATTRAQGVVAVTRPR